MKDSKDSENHSNGSKVVDNNQNEDSEGASVDTEEEETTTNIAPTTNNKRGPYNKPLKQEALRQIRRMLVDQGLSHVEIMDKLRISERSFYRYRSELFQHDRMLIAEQQSDEEILNQLIICEERLLRQRRDILDGIANNPRADWRARVEGHHLAGEIAAVVMKLRLDSPSMLADRHKFPNLPALTLHENSSGVKVTIKNLPAISDQVIDEEIDNSSSNGAEDSEEEKGEEQ